MASSLYAVTMEREEIDEEDFTDVELAILDKLEEGRCTPSYLAEELDVTSEYVQNRLKDLRRLGLIEKVHRGLYETKAEAED